jgi:hypothetical protein
VATSRRDFLRRAALGTTAVALTRHASAGPEKLDEAARRTLEAILADKEVWGKGFGMVVASLPAWAAGGVDKVLVFPEQVVGATAFKTDADAAAARAKLAEVKVPKEYAPRAAAATAHQVADAPALKPQVLKSFADDGSIRLAWRGGEGARFLADGLTIAAVRQKFGKAGKVQTVAISSERDSRPLVLTFHEYADGAVAFVESDATPTPGLVNRVVLTTAPSVGAVFEEKK